MFETLLKYGVSVMLIEYTRLLILIDLEILILPKRVRFRKDHLFNLFFNYVSFLVIFFSQNYYHHHVQLTHPGHLLKPAIL